MQVAVPTDDAYVPAAQLKHDAAPTILYLPVGQFVQAPAEVDAVLLL